MQLVPLLLSKACLAAKGSFRILLPSVRWGLAGTRCVPESSGCDRSLGALLLPLYMGGEDNGRVFSAFQADSCLLQSWLPGPVS